MRAVRGSFSLLQLPVMPGIVLLLPLQLLLSCMHLLCTKTNTVSVVVAIRCAPQTTDVAHHDPQQSIISLLSWRQGKQWEFQVAISQGQHHTFTSFDDSLPGHQVLTLALCCRIQLWPLHTSLEVQLAIPPYNCVDMRIWQQDVNYPVHPSTRTTKQPVDVAASC